MQSKMMLVICILILGFIGCQKGKDYKSNGIIIGPDIRMCICCGGWYIQIDSLTYEFDSIPRNSNINLQKDSFPIFVKLDWELSTKAGCLNKRITIQRILKE